MACGGGCPDARRTASALPEPEKTLEYRVMGTDGEVRTFQTLREAKAGSGEGERITVAHK